MSGSKSMNVGVIGLGIIGSRVAECLRRAGHNVFVWNRTARMEPNFLASPQEIAEVAQFIQIFVRDADALNDVMKQMQPGLKKTHVVCAHSTVSAAGMKHAFAYADEVGAGFLDAPFTGSKVAAEKGELVYYVSGDAREQEKAAPLLQCSSKKVLNFGTKVGDATVLKIATNLVSGAVVEALAEALAITQAQGLEGAQLLEAFQNNANCSPLITMKLPAMMTGSFEPHFSLKNMLKDARYAQELAKDKSIATPVLDAGTAAMDAMEKAGRGDSDYSVVYESFAPRKSVHLDFDDDDEETMPEKKKLRITLKASKFQMAEEEEDKAEGAVGKE
jgi:3-hydroxyisobutyrate dehydrogenase-like beta-hydroxyacid dehydrogenase